MKQVDLGFTRIEIHAHYGIVRTKEGADIGLAQHRQVRDAIEHEIEGPYGLIFDWINSYSVSPDAIEAIRENPRIACCAVVSYRDATVMSLTGAAETIKKPGMFFSRLNDAQQWVNDTLAHK